ncbi:MAG: DNA repair protein RecN [Pseudoruminococcus massiliensis]|jgi:DNA repair protein RecN (Recombination protein N)|uniref:DNA repair protein RecN n=1 Tax=Pseudoruminococcus massiliensis TaxID=2086583 RepID=UPI00399245CD|nr:DNA repair protein RecN [Oscillospiraceae bacterium]
MLSNLYIENIAVIEKTSIDFKKGLNVMTGETGAGKSIVIDSINAVLGNRTSKELIRTGASSAFVSAEFTNLSEKAIAVIDEAGFELEDGELLIQREISTTGKNKCRINGRPATVSTLKEIGVQLINIHGQHESYELMSPELHISYIDKLAGLESEIEAYQEVYKKYKMLSAELKKATVDESERERKIDLLKYQIDELEDADLRDGEYEELNEQKAVLQNSEKIIEAIMSSRALMNGDEESSGVLENLQEINSQLSDISEYMSEVEPINSRIESAIYELEDCLSELTGLTDLVDTDGGSLDSIEERLDLIYTLGKKYGSTIKEMLDFLDKAKKELNALVMYDENREALIKECDKAYKEAEKLAKALSEKRRATSSEFADKVCEEMAFLDMPNVKLVVVQEKCELNSLGCDNIEFLISTNPGEPPKPISKIASGGELSRMMLAVKNVLSDKDDIDTLIFDEVDTGISGSAAQKVGLKLREVSKSRQVLCVTHLAQIAAMGNSHFKISKSVRDEKTFTKVEELDHEGRKQELARIIGGTEMTKASLDYAEEMLRAGENI